MMSDSESCAVFLPPVEGGKKRWIKSHNVVISNGLNSKDKNQEGLWINRRQHLNRRPWLRLDLWATPTLWLWQSQSRWASRSLGYMVVNRFRFAWCVRHWFKGCKMLSMKWTTLLITWYFHVTFPWGSEKTLVLRFWAPVPKTYICQATICIDQDVLRFQVTVHNVQFMTVPDGKRPLFHATVWYHEVIIFCLFIALAKPYRVQVPSQHITSDKNLFWLVLQATTLISNI